jgi:REP element-mobilizing transposase RayT
LLILVLIKGINLNQEIEMADSYSQIYIQIVFAVKRRENLIRADWEERLYQYITGVVKLKGQKLLAINGMPDHIHIFIGMTPNCCLSDLVREIKKSSTNFINENKLASHRFAWQEGFGAFSYSFAQKQVIINYVLNQKEHHRKLTFRDEYVRFLKEFEIEYDAEYLFEFYSL